jgi:hypothetical protein
MALCVVVVVVARCSCCCCCLVLMTNPHASPSSENKEPVKAASGRFSRLLGRREGGRLGWEAALAGNSGNRGLGLGGSGKRHNSNSNNNSNNNNSRNVNNNNNNNNNSGRGGLNPSNHGNATGRAGHAPNSSGSANGGNRAAARVIRRPRAVPGTSGTPGTSGASRVALARMRGDTRIAAAADEEPGTDDAVLEALTAEALGSRGRVSMLQRFVDDIEADGVA